MGVGARLKALGTTEEYMMTLLIVDDQPTVRQGLRMRLGLEPDLEIAGEAADGIEAIELTHVLKPHVVLMDVSMPRMDGITATKAIRAIAPDTRVVVISLHSDRDTREQAAHAGASAFVDKHAEDEELLKAIRDADN
jgi:DNA-binding NarL/FixJ family response regulator